MTKTAANLILFIAVLPLILLMRFAVAQFESTKHTNNKSPHF